MSHDDIGAFQYIENATEQALLITKASSQQGRKKKVL
jgi:hypothetical protein